MIQNSKTIQDETFEVGQTLSKEFDHVYMCPSYDIIEF